MNQAQPPSLRRRIWITASVTLLTVTYCVLASLHIDNVNIDVHGHDQSAYLEYAQEMSASSYSYLGGRNRMPVFPFLASLVYEEGLSGEDFFVRVKRMNALLSLLVLALVYTLLRRKLPLFEATTLFLIVASTVFIYRSGYAQADLLFYGLFFWAFLLLASQLRRPTWKGALLAGVVAGVAHLTKASLLPLLACFLFWGICGAIEALGLFHRTAVREEATDRNGYPAIARMLSCSLVVAAFLITMSPYMLNSKEHFGSYLYNSNSTYYIWLDSWGAVTEMEEERGGHKDWQNLPTDEIPGPAKYFREHSLGEILARTAEGIRRPIIKSIFKPFAYGKYLVLYLVVFGVILHRRRSDLREIFDGFGVRASAAFAASSVLGFTVLYCFYSPIASGSRLLLGIYLPMMFCLFWLLSRPSIRNELLFNRESLEVRLPHLHIAVLLSLSLDLVFHLPRTITKVYSGG